MKVFLFFSIMFLVSGCRGVNTLGVTMTLPNMADICKVATEPYKWYYGKFGAVNYIIVFSNNGENAKLVTISLKAYPEGELYVRVESDGKTREMLELANGDRLISGFEPGEYSATTFAFFDYILHFPNLLISVSGGQCNLDARSNVKTTLSGTHDRLLGDISIVYNTNTDWNNNIFTFEFIPYDNENIGTKLEHYKRNVKGKIIYTYERRVPDAIKENKTLVKK